MTNAGVFPATGNTQPLLDFINVNAGGTINELFAPIPTSGPHAIASNQWFHVAVTYNGPPNQPGNFKFYWTAMNPTNTSANLILCTNLPVSLPQSAVNKPSFAIGNGGRNDHANWLGLLDEVRLSSIARSPTNMMFVTPGNIVSTSPTTLTATVSGGTLTLSWPAGHTGWPLQSQTNALRIGLVPASNAWFNWPGSATTNAVSIPIDPANPTVFFRLVYPCPGIG